MDGERCRKRDCVILKSCFLAHAGAIVGIVIGIIFPLSALISISACIGVVLFVNRSRRNRHRVTYNNVVDNNDSTTSFSTSVAAANSTTCKFISASQPATISNTCLLHSTQPHIPQSTRAPTAASNEATTQPPPNTATLALSFNPAQTMI